MIGRLAASGLGLIAIALAAPAAAADRTPVERFRLDVSTVLSHPLVRRGLGRRPIDRITRVGGRFIIRSGSCRMKVRLIRTTSGGWVERVGALKCKPAKAAPTGDDPNEDADA